MAAFATSLFTKALRPTLNLKLARLPTCSRTPHIYPPLSRVSLNNFQKMPLVGLLSLIGASEVLITMATPREPIRRPQVTINQSIQEALKTNGIIPDVVDDFVPSSLVSIQYPSGKEVSLGNTLRPSEAVEQPKIQVTPSGDEDDATYTLVLTDPDAPSRQDPKWAEFCHWIVTDIKVPTPEDIANAASIESTFIKLDQGKTLIDYMGPAPPKRTGKHRYVFLIYKNGVKKPTEGPKERKKWGNEKPRTGVREWASKNGLTLVGANFFFAQNDDQSPKSPKK